MIAGSIDKPEDVFNFGFAHLEQIKLVLSCQDALLKAGTGSIITIKSCDWDKIWKTAVMNAIIAQ